MRNPSRPFAFLFILVLLVVCLVQVKSQTCSWELASNSLFERNEAPSAIVDGKLFVFGGFNDSFQTLYEVESYDHQMDIWTSMSPMLNNVTHFPVVVIEDEIWIIGGFEGDHPGVATDLVQVYNTSSNTWTYGPSIPNPRASFAAARSGSRIHIFGGLLPDRKTDTDEHYIYNLASPEDGWQEATSLPEPRNHLSGASLGGKIYGIGGQTGHDGPKDDKNFVHVYDHENLSWSQVADLPTDRSHFEPGTFVMDGKIVIAGGREANFFYDDVLIYDPEYDIWNTLCTMDVNLMAPISRAWSDTLLVGLGGQNSSNNTQDINRITQVERTFPTELGFHPDTLVIFPDTTGTTSISSAIFTLEGSAGYYLASSITEQWITVVNPEGSTNTDGTEVIIEIIGDSITDLENTYELTFSAPGYDDALLVVSTEGACTSCTTDTATVYLETLYRVNCGGTGQSDDYLDWSIDKRVSPSSFCNSLENGNKTYSVYQSSSSGLPIDLSHATIHDSTEVELFKTLRYDKYAAPDMEWDFPVPLGIAVEIRLYFAELLGSVTASDQRVFDVTIDGNPFLADFDVFTEADGNSSGIIKKTMVTSDGNIDIDFHHEIDKPFVNAIEIIEIEMPSVIDPVVISSNLFSLQFGQTTTENASTNTDLLLHNGEEVDITIEEIVFSGPDALDFQSTMDLPVLLVPGASLPIEVIFSPSSSGEKNAELIIQHTASNNPLIVMLAGEGVIPVDAILINCGGSDYNSVAGLWYQEDIFFGSGQTYSINSTIEIGGTDDDELYRTERYDDNLNYNIPVDDGLYNIRLHFAEIYFGLGGELNDPPGGERIMDVSIESEPVLSEYDIYETAGGSAVSIVEEFVISVSDGAVTIELTGIENKAKVSAIEIINLSDTLDCSDYSFDLGQDTMICSGETLELTTPAWSEANSWSTGDTMSSIQVSESGQYSLEAQIQSCIISDTIQINVNPSIEISIFAEDPSFFGAEDGAIDLIVAGGVPPYTFVWSTGSGEEDLQDLIAGEYEVIVTDFNSCVQDTTLILWDPVPCYDTLDLGENLVLCPGDTIALESGFEQGEFSWSTGDTSSYLLINSPGWYYLQVSAFSCLYEDSLLIEFSTQPEFLYEITNETSPGASDGSIDLTIYNGVSPLEFSWSNGSNEEDISGLVADIYTISLIDGWGCQWSDQVTILQDVPCIFSFDLGPDTTICSHDSILVGTMEEDWIYTWSTGQQTNQIWVNMPGTYFLEIDDGLCSYSDSLTVFHWPQIGLTSSIINESEPGLADGSIDVTIQNGIPPVSFLWNTGETTEDLVDISSGTYSVTATDSVQCFVQESFTISSGICDTIDIDADPDMDLYSTYEELINGSDPCDSSSTPPDFDFDGIPDLSDPDDDNDGIDDVHDVFALDSLNGHSTQLPIILDWTDGTSFDGVSNTGFTGLMVNYEDDYADLFTASNVRTDIYPGNLSIIDIPEGDAYKSRNDQKNVFHLGILLDSTETLITAHTRISAPFEGITPEDHQSMGIYLGTGDQDNYIKFIIRANGGNGGTQVLLEVNGLIDKTQSKKYGTPVLGSSYVDLYLYIDPIGYTAQPAVSINGEGIMYLHNPRTLPADWFSNALAVGIYCTSESATQTFDAHWDVFEVTTSSARMAQTSFPISESSLKLFPNPVSGQLHVEFPDLGITKTFEIAVVDIQGKEQRKIISEYDGHQNYAVMDVSGLTPGIYLIELTSDKFNYASSFVKY